jgi:hypothetical protein
VVAFPSCDCPARIWARLAFFLNGDFYLQRLKNQQTVDTAYRCFVRNSIRDRRIGDRKFEYTLYWNARTVHSSDAWSKTRNSVLPLFLRVRHTDGRKKREVVSCGGHPCTNTAQNGVDNPQFHYFNTNYLVRSSQGRLEHLL